MPVGTCRYPILRRPFSQTARLLKKKPKKPSRAANGASSSHASPSSSPTARASKPTTASSEPAGINTAPSSKQAHAIPLTTAADDFTLAGLLARKGTPTTLYAAPPQGWFLLSSYLGGAYCFSYAAFHVYSVYFLVPAGVDPGQAPQWVQTALFAVTGLMGAFGTFLLLAPGRCVLRLTALPLSLAASGGTSGGVAGLGAEWKGVDKPLAKFVAAKQPKDGSRASLAPVAVEARIRRTLAPFLPPKRILFAPQDIVLPTRMHTLLGARSSLTDAERTMALRARRAETSGPSETLDEGGLLKRVRRLLPWSRRQMPRGGDQVGEAEAVSVTGPGFWASVRRAFTREGFAKVRMAGKTYKVDFLGAWALEDGRALDRLVKIGGSGSG